VDAQFLEPGTESYSASKGGIVALTHALAVSLGPDIRVNCVSPGCSETFKQYQCVMGKWEDFPSIGL
jgi:NAD(P)-dependent dehydrogenase (short-subunit alcohol dehydrogenase family)